jgi:hypothetical protein
MGCTIEIVNSNNFNDTFEALYNSKRVPTFKNIL